MKPNCEGFVASQGINLHYLAKNTGSRDRLSLLFVPGVMMPAWIWEKQLEHFSKKYRVVAMDPRSQGESERSPEGNYAFSMAKDIKAVVDHLGLEPFVLIGWSMAVSEVVNYAAHFGGPGLKGLVLIDGLCGIDSSVPFYQSTVDYWTQLQTDRGVKTREFVRSIFKQQQTEAYLEKLTQEALSTPTNTVMTMIENYLLQDFRPLLPQIKPPALIATVEGPRLGYMQAMRQAIPNCRLEIIKDAGHVLFVDQPEQFNHLLDAFIAGLVA